MGNDRATGAERQEWDRKSCVNIFEALKLDLTERSIKFCRRVGEKGDEPRPLVTGFYTEWERNELLRNGRYLVDMDFNEVSVGPDLTRKQRQEEGNLEKEAEKKNEYLNEEDVAKNLRWTVVGGKGERRLIKTVQREWMRGGRGPRGMRDMRGGRTRQEQRTGTGGHMVSRGEKEKQCWKETGRVTEGRNPVAAESEDDSEMEVGEGAGAGMRRMEAARNDKRKERSPEAEGPPSKR
jgi:hypothetical protein